MEETFGQKRIGVDFAATDEVSEVKRQYAERIDRLLERRPLVDAPIGPYWADCWNALADWAEANAERPIGGYSDLQIIWLEIAAMYRVKAMTQGRKLDGKEA